MTVHSTTQNSDKIDTLTICEAYFVCISGWAVHFDWVQSEYIWCVQSELSTKNKVGREVFGMSFMFAWWCIFTSHRCRVCWIGWFLKCIFFHPSTNDLFSGSIKPSNYIINMPIFNKCTQLKENGKRTSKKNTTKCAGVTVGTIHGLICVCAMLFSVCSNGSSQ